MLFSSPLVACTLVRSWVSVEASEWECAISALGLTPVLCVPAALEFSPVCCEVGAHCPLIASFLLVQADAEPCEECSDWRWVSPFAYKDLRSSRLVGRVLHCSNCNRFWEHRLCDSYIKFASIHSTTARIVSTFCSTYDNLLACSSTSMMVDYRMLWVCSWVYSLTRVDVPATYLHIFAIFPINMAPNL